MLASAMAPVTASAGKPTKVDVSHRRGNGGFHHINISENAFAAHVAHGDGQPGQPVSGMTGYSFDANCQPVADEPPVPGHILAVAYGNLDGVDGFDPAGTDVLIAKLVDTNLDGVASAGDTVFTTRYPLDFEMTAFGDFAITSHTVDRTFTNPGSISVAAGGDSWSFRDLGDGEVFEESNVGSITEIRDHHAGVLNGDRIDVDSGSPSMPSPAVFIVRFPDEEDQDFIVVDIFPPTP